MTDEVSAVVGNAEQKTPSVNRIASLLLARVATSLEREARVTLRTKRHITPSGFAA